MNSPVLHLCLLQPTKDEGGWEQLPSVPMGLSQPPLEENLPAGCRDFLQPAGEVQKMQGSLYATTEQVPSISLPPVQASLHVTEEFGFPGITLG